jgi:hypothetical protein
VGARQGHMKSATVITGAWRSLRLGNGQFGKLSFLLRDTLETMAWDSGGLGFLCVPK